MNTTAKKPPQKRGRKPWAVTPANADDVRGYLARKIQRDYAITGEYLYELDHARAPAALEAWARTFLGEAGWESLVRAMKKQAERQAQREAGRPAPVTVNIDSDVHWDLRAFLHDNPQCATLSDALRVLLAVHGEAAAQRIKRRPVKRNQ